MKTTRQKKAAKPRKPAKKKRMKPVKAWAVLCTDKQEIVVDPCVFHKKGKDAFRWPLSVYETRKEAMEYKRFMGATCDKVVPVIISLE